MTSTSDARAMSIAAVSFPAAAMRSGVSSREIALVALMGEAVPTSMTSARRIDHLDVGVAQIERVDDRFFEFAPLRGGVENNRHGRGAVTRTKRARVAVTESRASVSDMFRRSALMLAVAERRFEQDVDVGKPRDRRQDHAAAGLAENEGVREA